MFSESNSEEHYMRDYFIAHASTAHIILKNWLKEEAEEFVFIDEFLVNFYIKDSGVVIILIAEDHDHADGYFVETRIQRTMNEHRLDCIFVTERDIIARPDFLKQKLFPVLR